MPIPIPEVGYAHALSACDISIGSQDYGSRLHIGSRRWWLQVLLLKVRWNAVLFKNTAFMIYSAIQTPAEFLLHLKCLLHKLQGLELLLKRCRRTPCLTGIRPQQLNTPFMHDGNDYRCGRYWYWYRHWYPILTSLLFCRGRQRNVPKCKTHVEKDCFALETNCFVAFSLPALPPSLLTLLNGQQKTPKINQALWQLVIPEALLYPEALTYSTNLSCFCERLHSSHVASSAHVSLTKTLPTVSAMRRINH